MDSGSEDSEGDEEEFIFGIDFSNLNVSGVIFDDDDKSIETLQSNELRKSSGTSLSRTIYKLLQSTNNKNNTEDKCHDPTEGLFQWASNNGASLE